jgi:hypothetical protein
MKDKSDGRPLPPDLRKRKPEKNEVRFGACTLLFRIVREQAKATVQWNEMLDEIRDGLRLTFDALVDKLSPKPDGTRKKLVGVDRLLEFLDTFSKKDVANDEQLRVLVEEVRGLLAGQDVSRFRKDQGLREFVQERMQSVKVVLDTLVEDAPARQIVLRD